MTRNDTATPESGQSPMEPNAFPSTPDRGTPTVTAEYTTLSRQPSSQLSGDTEMALVEAESRIERISPTPSNVRDFRPFQELFNTPVTLEFGENLVEDDKYIVHLELLCCYSNTIARTFKSAEEQRHLIAAATVLKEGVKALISALDTFNLDKALNLLGKCLKHYPLLEYQNYLRKVLESFVNDKFKETKNWEGPSDANRKKIPPSDIMHRLQVLKVEYTMATVQHLDKVLQNIEKKERNKALNDPVKAAAQLRIILPNFDSHTVRCVVAWIYRQTLHFSNAHQLYQIYELATALGIEALAEICVNKLLGAAQTSIRQATSQKNGLRVLLETTNEQPPADADGVHDPLANVIPTIFTRILEDVNAPKVLQRLAINAIVDHADVGLYSNLKTQFSRPILEDLLEEFVRRRSGVEQEKAA